MGRFPGDKDGRLLSAVADNHREWFRSRGGTNGIWTMDRNDALGVRLVARGYEWGWRPHWMGIDLDGEPEAPSGFEVRPAEPPFANTLPYVEDLPLPPGAIHLGVALRVKVVGQAIVLPRDGVAGIYSMGVVPKVRGRGIGMALVRAALRAAWDAGCDAAVLNATPEGERLYARVGFRSLGWGQTWWPEAGAEPTERSIAIAEAVGFGDLAALEALAPTEAEAARTLHLAWGVEQNDSMDFLLARFPCLRRHRG
jgi:GNAT superfamily N-acetyltransferase